MPSKAHAKTLRRHIEKGAASLTDEEALEAVELFPEWKPETDYKKDNRVREDGLLYRLIPETHHSGERSATYALLVGFCIMLAMQYFLG